LSASIVKLRNRIQPYAWGSRHAIAELQGRPAPTAGPEAELWIGDHPAAPSCVIESVRAGSQLHASSEVLIPLSEWISRDPEGVLGSGERCRVPHLPFLAKILAAERPLSVQVHPDAEQADTGFEREESAAVAADGRSYPDRIAKREVIIALSRFEVLCGLRLDADVTRVLRDSSSEAARSLLADAIGNTADAARPACLAARLFRRIQDLPAATRESLLDELSVAQQPQASSGEHDEHHWVARLREEHPGDPLALAPLLLNLVSLAPGEGLAVEPGTLHCYLAGTGVEVMTRSDNIVRAGLTRKPVDRNAVREIAREHAVPARRILPVSSEDGLDAAYTTGIDDFDVAVLRTPEGRVVPRSGGRVSVLLCVAGSVAVQARPPGPSGVVRLDSGEAALIPACVESYELRGTGREPRVFAVSSR
jgi:mannose-6-phosphate isomerase